VRKTLAAHPDVAEAVVIVDDEQYGQRPAAFVVLVPGRHRDNSVTPDTLKQDVRENLANYKVPREMAIVDGLPRGSTGKILRNELLARVGGS
jgi:acyl-coenzyme A synthetase/AMP-(fatty) acid ligase